jgi:hypothetical protein
MWQPMTGPRGTYSGRKRSAVEIKESGSVVSLRRRKHKFFQAYARGRKMNNTIWALKNQRGEEVNKHTDLAELGIAHFKDLFTAQQGTSIAEIIRVARLFPRFLEEDEVEPLTAPVSERELLEVLQSFQRGKSPGPDGWPIEFYLGCLDILGSDLLKVVEESRERGHIHNPINATFIALIPKSDNPSTFEDFRPISLCNCLYKIISKVISRRLKAILSKHISCEQFGFLEGRQIHEAIGVAQEGLHSIKLKKLKVVVVKIDLSKAFDRVNWLYIRMLLIHLGFGLVFVNWIMACLSSVSFSILLNGSATKFFLAERGLRQGCPLSPLLFLLVAEGLSRFISGANLGGRFAGIKITNGLIITHLLFVDDILIFCDGSTRDADTLSEGLTLFRTATGMRINAQKSSILFSQTAEEHTQYYLDLLPFQTLNLEEGLKYLGFHLKPNDYRKTDWYWLLEKLEKRLKTWSNKWLSRAGRLVLIKSVLEAIPVYWMSLSWIPKGILEKARKLAYSYLWRGKSENRYYLGHAGTK